MPIPLIVAALGALAATHAGKHIIEQALHHGAKAGVEKLAEKAKELVRDHDNGWHKDKFYTMCARCNP